MRYNVRRPKEFPDEAIRLRAIRFLQDNNGMTLDMISKRLNVHLEVVRSLNRELQIRKPNSGKAL